MYWLKNLLTKITPASIQEVIPEQERKRILLTFNLCLLWIGIILFYTITDLLNNVHYALPAYAFFSITFILAIYLINKQKNTLAKLLLFVSGALIVFYASLVDPLDAGAFFLFIPISLFSFILFDYKRLTITLILNCIVLILFLISFYGLIDVDVSEPSAHYIQISFAINFVMSIATSTLILYSLVRLNFESSEDLQKKEKAIFIKNQELEKINKELDRFVYSVSHDLRSPLSSILGILNLAKYTDEKDELRNYLELIEGRIKAQDHFIKNITDFSRNVRITVKQEKVGIRSFVLGVIDTLRFLPGASSINFLVTIEDDLIIQTDALRLQIILNNLVSNAIKYSDSSKEKTVIEIGSQLLEKEICLYVKDNGIGISPEWLPKVFDMFTRATERSSGSGLGLFITKESIEKIGGTLSVESTLGKGSIFSIYLPNVTH
jgi:signal transduction histidine kinase